MKYSTLQAFEKHLESAHPDHLADIYLIIVKDSSMREQALATFCRFLPDKKSNPSFAKIRIDVEQKGVDPLLRELNAFSLFTKKKTVVAENVETLDKASSLKLEHYLNTPNRLACFVAVTGSINRATTLYKTLEKTGVVLDLPEEKPWEKEKNAALWLRQEALKEKKECSLPLCELIVKQIGIDRMLLLRELEKLICFVGARKEISKKDVEAISSLFQTETIWQLNDALLQRDVKGVLRVSKGLLTEGMAPIALLRQIRSQFQTKLHLCSLVSSGSDTHTIAQEFPYIKGAMLEKQLKQTESYGMNSFRKGILAIDHVELELKNSQIDPEFALEKLFIELCKT